MNQIFVDAEFRLWTDTTAGWIEKDPILAKGEPGHNSDTGELKIGNGVFKWSQLRGFIPTDGIEAFINDYLAQLGPDGGAAQIALNAHVNSDNPHPVYDDGPSFLLLYENAKV